MGTLLLGGRVCLSQSFMGMAEFVGGRPNVYSSEGRICSGRIGSELVSGRICHGRVCKKPNSPGVRYFVEYIEILRKDPRVQRNMY